ncbi:MAG TPA: glycosyltransferase family 39 protein, partial [Bryobacterales bacterium]|nr:glycosyltransferase family 39 protein [Bryobacterales bacterium]
MAPNLEKLHRYRHALALLLLALLLALLDARCIPNGYFRLLGYYDSGIFAYMGQQLAQGAVLYRDVWDHKPPLIYYLNELGVWLGRGSPGGILAICFVAGLGFLATIYAVVAPALGALPALVGALLALCLFPALAETPNSTEAFAMPLQALSLLLLLREWGGERRKLYALAQGAIGALLFLLRPNCIGVTVVYVLVMGSVLLRERKIGELAGRAGLLGLGFGVVSGAVVAPLALAGAWRDFLYAAFGYNVEYVRLASFYSRLASIFYGFQVTSQFGCSMVAAAAALAVVARRGQDAAVQRLGAAGALLLAVEALMSSASGRGSWHYYLAWLPAMIVLTAYFFHLLKGKEGTLATACLAVTLAGYLAVQGAAYLRGAFVEHAKTGRIVDAARAAARPSDRVTVWGDTELEIHFRLGRRPGSRLFHTTPLQHDRSLYRKLAAWILSDL